MTEKHSTCRLAIIVIIFNMQREAPRTLFSLSADYQKGVSSRDYEVIVVENGSSEPVSKNEVERFGSNFRYVHIENASRSPAAAINFAVSQTSTKFVGIMVDGARMASPGIIRLALKTLESFNRPVVGTNAYHLGPDIQPRSIPRGYNREVEDKLLSGIDWRNNGYGLFDISSIAPSSSIGRLKKIAAGINPQLARDIGAAEGLAESSLIFMPRSLFDELQGFDERFDLPGGGLVNQDFYKRACDLEDTTLINLSGEATFHQMHGGRITNRTEESKRIEEFESYREQFQQIRGVPFEPSNRIATVIGFAEAGKRGCVETGELQLFVDPASVKMRVLHLVYVLVRKLKGLIRKMVAPFR